jgi:APA family basic amino acid/polyamine antiporter
VFFMSGLPGSTWMRLLVWLVIGLAVYFLWGRANAERVRRMHASRQEARSAVTT